MAGERSLFLPGYGNLVSTRRGDLWSPAKRSHRLLAVARSHLPCKAKEAFLRSRKFVMNLKPRPLGEVAPSGDGEGLFVGTDVLGCPIVVLGRSKR